MSKALVALAFLALNFYVYQYFASKEVIPPREAFVSFPHRFEDWNCDGFERMEPKVEENLGVTDYVICNYHRSDPPATVNVYLGYHETQIREEGGGAGENSIHPPKHCLPGSGWDIIAQQKVPLDLAGLPQRPAEVNRLVIAKGEARELVYYWYQEQGRVIADDWKKIVYMTLDRARRSRTDGSLIRFSAPIRHNDEARADAEILDLAALILPQIPPYVPE
jgi:EpsI family protein